MKSPFVIPRIALAILLILVITLLPHHHHGGEVPCWTVENCDDPLHSSCQHHGHEHPTPCNDDVCYLQATKFFVQGERPDQVLSFLFLGNLPRVCSLEPTFFWIEQQQTTAPGCLLPTPKVLARTLRGPPMV